MQLCINSTKWDFETTLIWIQMDGTTPGNQMIISNQRRNVGATLGAKLISFPSIDPGTRSFMNELTIFVGNDNSHRLPQCRARLQPVYPLVHMSVPSEQQVSLHTDSWQHHNPEPRIQEEPSYVTFECSNHRCRPPQSGSSMKLLVPCHQVFLS